MTQRIIDMLEAVKIEQKYAAFSLLFLVEDVCDVVVFLAAAGQFLPPRSLAWSFRAAREVFATRRSIFLVASLLLGLL